LHKWKARINNIDFDNYLLEDFTKLMGPLWEVVAVGTMVWIIDTESVEFEAAVKTQINTIISTTCVSLLLMLVVFYISWLIRAKIDQVYSVFSHLHEEEVEREIQRLSNIGESLGTVCIQEQQFYKEVFMMYFIKKTEHQNNAQAMSSNFNGSQKKSNTSIMARAYRSNTCRIKSSGFFGRFHCYNIGTFIFVIGVMMLAFSTTSLLILDRVSSNNKDKLDLMKLYRKFGTSNASLNFINFRMYLGVLVQSGLGANFVTFDNNYQYFNTFVNRFAAFEREYDEFATQEVPRKGKFTANFASMIDEKPCNYVDKQLRKISLTDCENLAGGLMGKNIIEVYRWYRISAQNLATEFKGVTRSTALSFLHDPTLIEYEYVRILLVLNFFTKFSENFFLSIAEYHKEVVFYIISVLISLLVTGIISTTIINICGSFYLFKQINICLSALLVVPFDSYNNNSFVAAFLYQFRK